MKHSLLKNFIKWFLCGIIISVFLNGFYIISLYVDVPSSCYYLVAFLIALVVLVMLKADKISHLFLGMGIMILGNFISEILLQINGITNCFYYRIHHDATEIALGEGVKLVLLYGLSAMGAIIGWVISFVVTMLHLRKNK